MQIIRRDVPDAGGEACRECLPGMAPAKRNRPAIMGIARRWVSVNARIRGRIAIPYGRTTGS